MADHPWLAGNLRITQAALDAVIADALRGYAVDEEACGYLLGPSADGALCDETVSMPNLAKKLHAVDPETYFRPARTFFAFNEKKFDDAVRQGGQAGRPVKVLYHSHLDAGAYFSATDRAVMSMGHPPETEGGPIALGPGPAWPLAFLVTSVRADGVDEHALFIWDGRDFADASFTVVAE
jgi:[CysO sulfur-carrier protein]-S-L-cysteine hydrolase